MAMNSILGRWFDKLQAFAPEGVEPAFPAGDVNDDR